MGDLFLTLGQDIDFPLIYVLEVFSFFPQGTPSGLLPDGRTRRDPLPVSIPQILSPSVSSLISISVMSEPVEGEKHTT
jgi:hypothetical protein